MSEKLSVAIRPAKKFFVDVLTRDINLEDCILDLLDNCVDGIERCIQQRDGLQYSNFYSEITLGSDFFEIKDNCGGIPLDIARNYAFIFGRPSTRPAENIKTIGVYGIGMKRAMFKLGKEITVVSKNNQDCFRVNIGREWMNSENWDNIEMERMDPDNTQEGTTITIKELRPEVVEILDSSAFHSNLKSLISQHYALILKKGFSVKVNNNSITPVQFNYRWQYENESKIKKNTFAPCYHEETFEGVKISIIAGYYSDYQAPQDDDYEITYKNRSERAGWTVICNDRIVLYCDKTYVTGWGDRIPNYHTQFISFSGIVIFESEDIEKLPLTTTKRGVEVGSKVFMHARSTMILFTRMFIDFTNKWKGQESIAKSLTSKSRGLDNSLALVRKLSKKVPRHSGAVQYKPTLPLPKPETASNVTMHFVRPKTHVDRLRANLCDSPATPSDVAALCFDLKYMEIDKDE